MVSETPKPRDTQTIISTIPTMHGRSTIEVEPANSAEFSSLERFADPEDAAALRSPSEGPEALSQN